jgi:hypothetical protein
MPDGGVRSVLSFRLGSIHGPKRLAGVIVCGQIKMRECDGGKAIRGKNST